MSFMEPQIYEDSYFEIETINGTECIPCSVCGIYTTTKRENLLDYCDDDRVYNPEERVSPRHGWICRMSAPGYMDCTPWTAFKTEQACMEYLDEMYGDDDE